MLHPWNITGGFAFDWSWWDLSVQGETAWRWAGNKKSPNGKLPQLVSTMLANNKEAGRLTHRIGFQEQMREANSHFIPYLLRMFPFSPIMVLRLNN
jgi:hypothetical protein